MALPDLNLGGVTPVGLYSYGGPFRSGGSVYHVHGSSGSNIDVYRSTNPGTDAWSLLDSGNNPTSAIHSYYSWQDGTDIKICTNSSTDVIHYHEFDMTAETWTTTDEVIDNGVRNTIQVNINVINLRSDGDRLVFSHGDEDKVHGTDRRRADISRWEGASWTIGIDVSGSPGDQDHCDPISAVMSGNDRFHCIWGAIGADVTNNSSYLSGNTFGVQADQIEAVFRGNNLNTKGVSYDNGGTEEVRIALDTPSIIEFDDADNPTYTLNTDADITPTRSHMAIDGTQKYIAGRGTASDIYMTRTGTNDDIYETETAIATVDFYNYMLGMNVYLNDDGDTVLGMVFGKNANDTPIDYDEFLIASSGTFIDMDVSLAGTSSIVSSINAISALHSAIPATSVISGSMSKLLGIDSSITAASTFTSALAEIIAITASVPGSSDVSAYLDAQPGLNSDIAATSINYCLQSEDPSDAAWTRATISLFPGEIDIYGNPIAWRVHDGSFGTLSEMSQSVTTPGGTICCSVFVEKETESVYPNFELAGFGITFDTSDGTVQDTNGKSSPSGSGVEDHGSHWRFYFHVNGVPSGALPLLLNPAYSQTIGLGSDPNATGGAKYYGFQVESGRTTPGPYKRTEAATSFESVWIGLIGNDKPIDADISSTSEVLGELNKLSGIYSDIVGSTSILSETAIDRSIYANIPASTTIASLLDNQKGLWANLGSTSAIAGSLNNQLGLRSVLPATSSIAAYLGATKDMRSTLTGLSTIAARLNLQKGISSTIPSISSIDGITASDILISSTIPGSSIILSYIDAGQGLTANIPAVSSFTSELEIFDAGPTFNDLRGVVAAAAVISGFINLDRPIYSSVDSTSSISGQLNNQVGLHSNIAASTSLLASINAQQGLRSAIAGVSAMAADLNNQISLGADISASSSIFGRIAVDKELSSDISAVSTIGAAISKIAGINSAIPSNSTIAAQIKADRGLTSNIAGVSSLLGELEIIGEVIVLLDADLTAVSSIVAHLNPTSGLNSTIAAASAIVGRIGAISGLEATINAITTISAETSVERSIDGSIDATVTISGELNRQAGLDASIDSISGIQASLNVLVPLNVSIDATSDMSGILSLAIDLFSNIGVASSIGVDINVNRGLSSEISATTSIGGLLGAIRFLESTIPGSADISGAMARDLQLYANISGLSSLLAELQIDLTITDAGSIATIGTGLITTMDCYTVIVTDAVLGTGQITTVETVATLV